MLDTKTLKKDLAKWNQAEKIKLGLACAQCGDDINGYGIKGYMVTCSICAADNNLEWDPRNEDDEGND